MKYGGGSPRSSVFSSDNAISQKSDADFQSSKKEPEKSTRNVSGDFEDDDYYEGFTGFDKEVSIWLLPLWTWYCVLNAYYNTSFLLDYN